MPTGRSSVRQPSRARAWLNAREGEVIGAVLEQRGQQHGIAPDQQADARRAGANDVLPKPMDLDQMAALLARWVKPRPQPA